LLLNKSRYAPYSYIYYLVFGFELLEYDDISK
jgi:hypothetical protein